MHTCGYLVDNLCTELWIRLWIVDNPVDNTYPHVYAQVWITFATLSTPVEKAVDNFRGSARYPTIKIETLFLRNLAFSVRLRKGVHFSGLGRLLNFEFHSKRKSKKRFAI